MSNTSEDKLAPPVGAFRLRALARRLRAERIGAPALLAVSLSLCVLIAGLLEWGGIVTGAVRVGLMLAAAAGMRLRLLAARLGAMAPMDGLDEASVSSPVRRWVELWQVSAILVAAGLSAFGSGSYVGPSMGGLGAVLALTGGWLGRKSPGLLAPARPDPTTALAMVCMVSAIEPLWGWRGQSLVIGLCLIAAVLAWRLWRLYRMDGAASPLPVL
jgi:hypothetical protein